MQEKKFKLTQKTIIIHVEVLFYKLATQPIVYDFICDFNKILKWIFVRYLLCLGEKNYSNNAEKPQTQ